MIYAIITTALLTALYLRGRYLNKKNDHRRLLLLKFDHNQARIDLYNQFSVESFQAFELDRALLWNEKVSDLLAENESILDELKIF